MTADNTLGKGAETHLKEGQDLFDQPVFENLFGFLPNDYFIEDQFRGRGVLVRLAISKRGKDNFAFDKSNAHVQNLIEQLKKRVGGKYSDYGKTQEIANETKHRLYEIPELMNYLWEEYFPFYTRGNVNLDRFGGAKNVGEGKYHPPTFDGYKAAKNRGNKFTGLELEVPGDSTRRLKDGDYRKGIRR